MAKRFFPPAWLKGGGRFAPSGQSSNRFSWALERSTTVLVAVALFVLVSVGLLSYYQARDLSATASAIHHTQEVLTQISVVRARLDEIPAASRGFALTGQPRFVQAFAANIAGIDSQLDRLQALTHGNAAQQERIELLRRLAKERIEVGRKVLDTRRLGGLADAAEMVSDDPGEKITLAIRRTLQAMEKAEHALLAERERASLAAHQGTFLLLPAGTLLSLMVLAAGVFRLNQEAVAVKNAHEKATMELLESISDGFYALDADWRFVRGNSAALRMLGKPREEVLGLVIWEVFPEMRDLGYERQFRKAKRENVTVRFEEADPNPGGDWFEIRAYPTHWGMNVFFNDITKRKQTEARLRQLSRAVEQSPSIVMITDTGGRIEYVNPKFTEITGYELEEVLGKNPRILRGPESIPRQGQELWEAIRAGHEWRGEFHNQKKSGEIYWEYASISPITDEHGRTTHFVAVKEDITRRKMMETSLVEAKREAEEASRAKDVFLAMLSHELRTPLAPVLLMASVSEADESLAPEVREQFQMIRNSIELEARLIDDLLDLTKVTRGKFLLKFKPFSAEEPLEKTLEMLRQDYEAKNLTLDWERSAAVSMVCADAARLHQVFWNLLKNAIKFTPAGGAIKIRTFNPDHATLAVEVRDTGVGIAREFLDQVFQPFQQGAATGKMQFGGLGLGLAITKAIVEMHGGTIHVDSPGVGLGSIFTVQIPLSNGEGASVPGIARPEPLGAGPLRILLVEDDKATRTVLSRLLGKDGHHVVTAGSCAEAFKALREQPEALPFERLLCDLGLPDGSGLDIVGPVKECSPGIRAIAISGFGMAEDVRRSREAGFDAHLVKPLNVEALRSTLARAA